MATLTQLTRTLDDDFTNTWYEIKSQVEDNVLEATVFSLALKERGCLKPQPGGEYGWTDTIGYGTAASQRFQAGSTLTQTPVALDTFVYLNWRFVCVDVNRSLVDDMKNQGKFQIKSYLARRLEAARNALVQDFETYLMQWGAYYPAPLQINGLWDICAPETAIATSGGGSNSDTYASGTSNGNCNRTNTWWRNWVLYNDATQANSNRIAGATNEPYALNLVSDMDHFFDCIGANTENPNFILTTQLIFEAYKQEVQDKQQVVRTSFDRKAADLGFDTITFRGQPMTWTTKFTTLHMFMLNLNYVDWNYHPNCWFDMTDWKSTSNQLERVAYIVCMSPGLATKQPRRHGVALWAS